MCVGLIPYEASSIVWVLFLSFLCRAWEHQADTTARKGEFVVYVSLWSVGSPLRSLVSLSPRLLIQMLLQLFLFCFGFFLLLQSSWTKTLLGIFSRALTFMFSPSRANFRECSVCLRFIFWGVALKPQTEQELTKVCECVDVVDVVVGSLRGQTPF